jgi:hypothetical protein
MLLDPVCAPASFLAGGGVPSVEELLAAACSSMAWAEGAERSAVRFHYALLAASQIAEVLLSSSHPGALGEADGDVWLASARHLPEFGEWSAYFTAAAAKHRGAAGGHYLITAREADDLLRDAQAFRELVLHRAQRRVRLVRGAG